MSKLPDPIRCVLRQLRCRLAIGVFLDFWPRWAVAGLLFAGIVVLICRLWFPGAAFGLPLLWIAPIIAGIPALIQSARYFYRPDHIAAIADSLSGGQGTLLALLETQDPAWMDSREIKKLSTFPYPRFHVWRRFAMLAPAAIFLVIALMLPQRMPAAVKTALGNDIAAELKTKLEALKKQDLIVPSEEKELQAEIERIRKDSLERVDASTWEASDSMSEKFAAKISEKQDAMKWAADVLSRFSKPGESGSANAGASGSANSDVQSGELGAAIDKLAHTGMLANAPEELQKLLGGKDAIAAGKCRLPKDAQSLKKLAASFKNYLGDQGKKFSDLAQRTGASRFDPSEYPPFNYDRRPDGDGNPGTGGLSRGRADADLTWGKESKGFDIFKSQSLPPGSYRSPDEWAPFAIMPGAPKISTELSGASSGMQYAGVAQSAWRRSLAPRHYSAVKKYFDNAAGGKN
jgi:hypothetical protein